MKHAFPNKVFPLGAVHEFICAGKQAVAVTSGFVAGLLGSRSKKEGAILWVSATRTLFPPALTRFGIAPEQFIFVDLSNEKQILWVLEEGLKCAALSAVVGEIRDLDFTVSRRLQLAVEQSKVTGFIIRENPRVLNTSACVTRWQISSLPSDQLEDLPGIGHPKWKVELMKVRNGKPATWVLEWVDGRFNSVQEIVATTHFQKKAG
jgi:protein ImuA